MGGDTVSSTYADKQPLGIGSIISDAFSIFFQRFGLMFALALLPALIQFLIGVLVPRPTNAELQVNPLSVMVPMLVSIFAPLAIYSLSNSLIVIASFDTKIG